MEQQANIFPSVHHGPIAQCADCPYGKQTRAPFRKTEELPVDIRDIIVSEVCGPFETSIAGYKYFILQMGMKSCFTTIDFLKDKICKTVTKSFEKYITWLLQQKKVDVKRERIMGGNTWERNSRIYAVSLA